MTDSDKNKFSRSNGIETLIRMLTYNVERRIVDGWACPTLSKSFLYRRMMKGKMSMNKMRVWVLFESTVKMAVDLVSH